MSNGFARPVDREGLLHAAKSDDPIAAMHSRYTNPAAESFRLQMRDALRSRIRDKRESMLANRMGPGGGGAPADKPVRDRVARPEGIQPLPYSGPPADPRAGQDGFGGDNDHGGTPGDGYAGRGTRVSGVNATGINNLIYDQSRVGNTQPGQTKYLEEAIGEPNQGSGWLKKLWERLFGDGDDDLPEEKSDK